MPNTNSIIKRERAAGALQAFNFQSIEGQARALVDAARAEAAAMIDRARSDVERLREEQRKEVALQAYEVGHAQGYEKGLAKGEMEGHEHGLVRASEEFLRKSHPTAQALEAALRGCEQAREGLSDQARDDLLGLALKIGCRLAERSFESDPLAVMGPLKRAIELVADRTSLDLFIGATEFETVQEYFPDLRSCFTDLHEVRIHADKSLGPGCVRVATPKGYVAVDLQRKIDEITEILLGGAAPEEEE